MMNAREIKEFRESLKTIGTKEIKSIALKILQSKGLNVKPSKITVREARDLIVEERFLNKFQFVKLNK